MADDVMRSKAAEAIQEISEQTLFKKATELWKQKWQAWDIHRHLLSLGVSNAVADKITLQVTEVDFSGTNTWSF
ncbi:hypothetical protein IQ277_27545 [Nostocales cyanobacterium LEGE 12452]|nr:hypothetical protein [Nostocales cyanobacterium LEGE 12452]